MDMYKIICPYCDCEHVPRDYEEGFQAVVCFECNKPFVNQTTMTPVFHSFCVVGFERKAQLPTPEEIEEDAKYYAEHPEELADIIGNSAAAKTAEKGQDEQPIRKVLPNHTGTSYLCDGDFVEIKYCSNKAVRTTWADLYGLLEEEERNKAILALLGPEGNEPKRTGVSHFLYALEAGLIPEAPVED